MEGDLVLSGEAGVLLGVGMGEGSATNVTPVETKLIGGVDFLGVTGGLWRIGSRCLVDQSLKVRQGMITNVNLVYTYK